MIHRSDTFCRRSTEIYLLLMVSVFQLFTGPGGYLLLGWKKFLLFAGLTGLWGLLLLIGGACRGRRRPGRPGCSELLILAFALTAVLSTVLSPWSGSFWSYETGRYDGLATYLLYCVILLGTIRCGRADGLLLPAFAAAYGVNCAVALLQLTGRNPCNLYPGGLNYLDPYVQETAPFLGTMGNIDLMSALHCLAIPVLGLTVLLGKRPRRFFLLLPLGAGLAVMAAAGVSSGFAALAAGAVVLVGFLPLLLANRYHCFPGRRRGTLLLAGWSFAAILGLGALAFLRFAPVPDGTLSELQSVLRGEIRPEFGSHRLAIWADCLRLFRTRPFLGTGPDTLGNLLSVRFSRVSSVTGTEVVAVVDNAHNEYLQHLTCFGLLGALPLLLLQVNTIRLLFRSRASRTPEHAILAGTCFCYMVQAFFNIGLCFTTPLLCISWALLLGSMQRSIAGSGTPPGAEHSLRRLPMQIHFYGQTNIGYHRENNEDNFCLNGFFREDVSCPTLERTGVLASANACFAVFDGMGGADCGEQASLLAAATAGEILCAEVPGTLEDFYSRANDRVCAFSASGGISLCGTTAAVLELRDGTFRCSNVGDSRLYLLRDGVLRRLSTDDSEYQRLKNLGVDAPKSKKNYLTQYVGVPHEEFEIEPHVSPFYALVPGDRFLLCSDGLTGTMDDDTLCRALSAAEDPAGAGEELICSALDNGETDNVTAVIVDIR